MTSAMPIPAKNKNTVRMLQHGMWMLLLVTAAMLIVAHRYVPERTGSIWIFGCAILAFVGSFALRDVMRKAGHRHTEDKLVNDVKTFLEREPVLPVARPVAPKPAVVAQPVQENVVPAKRAGFVHLKGTAVQFRSTGDPVCFDAMPSREAVVFNTNLHAVLLPVTSGC